MAIIGGAGNPVGGSFTGPAQALEIIGDHCYAYSGAVTTPGSTNLATYLDFTSGNYYAVTELQLLDSYTGNADRFVEVLFNGATVIKGTLDDSPSKYGSFPYNLIIPPYTEVLVKWGINGQTQETTCFLTGKIYRTRD